MILRADLLPVSLQWLMIPSEAEKASTVSFFSIKNHMYIFLEFLLVGNTSKAKTLHQSQTAQYFK